MGPVDASFGGPFSKSKIGCGGKGGADHVYFFMLDSVPEGI
ncbi:hypothetical protein CTA1_12921 [Colletotrichum tanaceti]|uniref:Uncharacterized protein n=1 Tax=Colletotrichum tanaceti TaxID=1306861 RepID=A0A4U6X284_9PEZI|nr:hypothetical protein CTA1_12921 [Colletotrichum tanaceti]